MNNSDKGSGPPGPYVLGHSDRELHRLSMQARLLNPITRQFVREAGIGKGMRVLDVGTGVGDVAFLAADVVGAKGEVVGVDRAPAALAAAKAQADARPLRNVTFHEGDATEMVFGKPFDAVIGRYVLLFQPDQGATLRKLALHLRPGGLIVFHEPDWESARSIPPAPTYDRCCQWIIETFHLAGTDTNMAGKLLPAFAAAGLPTPKMRMRTFIGGAAGCVDFLQAVAELIGAVLPTMEQLGVAMPAEVDYPTLAERLGREVTASGSVIIGRSEICAWSSV
jgi:SAM-dependent methyltransferase